MSSHDELVVFASKLIDHQKKFSSSSEQTSVQSCAVSPISIILLYKFKSNTVPGSGPGSEWAMAVVGPQIITNHSLKQRESHGDQ